MTLTNKKTIYMKTSRLFLTLAITLAPTFSLSAQKAIDNEIARLEKQSNIQVYYTEKRNPATKKFTKSQRQSSCRHQAT